MTVLRAAQAQIPVYTDRQAVSSCVMEAAREASDKGADFLILPEMFCCPYDASCFPRYAEEEGGPIWQLCADAARRYGLFLSAGTIPERDSGNRIYNTAYVFDRKGSRIAKYRKMHLFDVDIKGGQHFRESAVLTPGESITTFETEFGTIGLAVCYDIRFPELFRLMALKGARLILVPASFNMTTGPLHWELLFCSQAVYNQVFIAGTAPARDENASYVSWSHSIITDPWGNIISEMNEEKELRIVDINLAECDRAREQIPVFQHRREDVYTLKER
nr:carbon-nitrogen hydrolase family protein [uncultured Mediterraneibacter sp.]